MTFDRDDIKQVALATVVFLFVNFSCRWVLILLLKGHPVFFDIPSWLFAADVSNAEIIRLGQSFRGARDLLFVPVLITIISSFLAYLAAHRIAGSRRFEKVHISIAIVWFATITAGAFVFLSSSTQERPDLLLKTIFIAEIVLFLGWIMKRQHDLKTKTD